jgi:hypothetical protein
MYTETTLGRVTSRAFVGNGTPVTTDTIVPLSIHGALIPIPTSLPRQGPDVYLYAIQSGSEAPIVTQSSVIVAEGACVKLWHAPLAPPEQAQYNFVPGDLEPSAACK